MSLKDHQPKFFNSLDALQYKKSLILQCFSNVQRLLAIPYNAFMVMRKSNIPRCIAHIQKRKYIKIHKELKLSALFRISIHLVYTPRYNVTIYLLQKVHQLALMRNIIL